MSAADAAGLKAGKDYPGPWPNLLPFVDLLVVLSFFHGLGIISGVPFLACAPVLRTFPNWEVPVDGLFRSPI